MRFDDACFLAFRWEKRGKLRGRMDGAEALLWLSHPGVTMGLMADRHATSSTVDAPPRLLQPPTCILYYTVTATNDDWDKEPLCPQSRHY